MKKLPSILCFFLTSILVAAEPIPDRLVVLTFDDASKSHFTVARPVLKKYGFGATFFVTEGFDFRTNQKDYMTWEEIDQLHRDGFEIGNHTRDHMGVTDKTLDKLTEQIRGIEERCKQHGIPRPTSFAYPGNALTKNALAALKDLGIRFARRGGAPEYPYKEGRGFAYEPGLDHPLLIPSAGDARPSWTMDDFKAAVSQARHGKIAVLQFHGVPDTAHDWVTTSKEHFEAFMKYLKDNEFTVIAMRDLSRYVDTSILPNNPLGVIEDRQRQVKANRIEVNSRRAKDDGELQYWTWNMFYHGFTISEQRAALGMDPDFPRGTPPPPPVAGRVLPYPGGRHPRIGFLDGAIRPQRETKVSVFPPWYGGYAVVDVPEAIWFEPGGKRELLYLAHTHIPTYWDKQEVRLPQLEWNRNADGSLDITRQFPNKVAFATKVVLGQDGVRLRFEISNGSTEKLTGLRVQMCVLLGRLNGFETRTNENKKFATPFAACHDVTGKRWLITGWEHCGRTWGNPPCPCVHADPQMPDCLPGEKQVIRGWLSFYEGTDIDAELRRLAKVAFE